MLSKTLRAMCFAAVCLALVGPASAGPLGIQVGDLVTGGSWDADKNVAGDGGFFDVGTGFFDADGRLTSLTVDRGGSPETIVQSNADLTIDLTFVSENNNLVGSILVAEAFLTGIAGPDFEIFDNGSLVLSGEIVGNLQIGGNIDTLSSDPQVVSGVAGVNFTGGDPNLLAALSGAGTDALVLVAFSTSDFAPPLANLAGDGQVFNSDFNVSLVQGTFTPLNNSPFVPEPSTAILVGAGLLGLVSAARRTRRS